MKNISKLLLLTLMVTLSLEASVQRVKTTSVSLQTSGDTYVGNSLNQNYSIDTASLGSGATVTLIDKSGINTLVLPAGLTISSSKVASNELVLILNNNTSINVRNADTFYFDVDGVY